MLILNRASSRGVLSTCLGIVGRYYFENPKLNELSSSNWRLEFSAKALLLPRRISTAILEIRKNTRRKIALSKVMNSIGL